MERAVEQAVQPQPGSAQPGSAQQGALHALIERAQRLQQAMDTALTQSQRWACLLRLGLICMRSVCCI